MDIDLRPTEVNVKFLRNTTIALTFYYLGPSGEVVDLSGHTGNMVVTDPDTGKKIPAWCSVLSTITGTTTYNKLPVVGAQGLYVEITPEVTTTAPGRLRYECILVSSTGVSTPLAYGSLLPFE